MSTAPSRTHHRAHDRSPGARGTGDRGAGGRGHRVVATAAVAVLTLGACSSGDTEAGPTGTRSAETRRSDTTASTSATGTTTTDSTTTDTPTTGTPTTGTSSTTGTPSSTTTSPGTTTTTSAPVVNTADVPEGLGTLARDLYRGERVPTNGRVEEVLGARSVSQGQVDVAGTVGGWKGTPIAVLTSGDDVTLAVQADSAWRIVGGWWPSLGVDGPVLGGTRHVLMIGSDARPDQPVDGMRADTLQVVGVDGSDGGGIMGIARDSWVTMPSGRQAKINNAMVEGGPAAQQATVADVTGLPLQGYLLTGFESFTALVNDLGGVTIDAPVPVLDVPAGQQTLDGETALRYSRERKTLVDGDFGRSRHQGVVLFGMAFMARAQGPAGLPGILTTASPHVWTNLSAAQVLTFGASVHVIDPGNVGHRVAKGDIGWSNDGQSIVRLDGEAYAYFDDFSDGVLGG